MLPHAKLVIAIVVAAPSICHLVAHPLCFLDIIVGKVVSNSQNSIPLSFSLSQMHATSLVLIVPPLLTVGHHHRFLLTMNYLVQLTAVQAPCSALIRVS